MDNKKSNNYNSNKIDIKDLRFYYGIPHAHCAFSTGRGTPIEAFDYARHNGLHFLILTDHNNYLNKTVRVKGSELTKWEASKYLTFRYNKKHENFIGIIGFESNTNLFGNITIVNSNRFFTGTVDSIQLLVLWMLNNPNAFISINHPYKSIEYLEYNSILNKLITSIDVGNGSYPNKYLRYEKYYYYLLDNGWKIGAINSQNNHRLNFGDDENLTCIITNELSINSIVNAFRNRRTYSTESRTLTTYFTINDYFMGDIISIDDTNIQFSIFAEDYNYKIKEIHIISSGGNPIKKITELNLNRIKYIYNHNANVSESWYLIKVILENNKIAISSPIFRE